ncbi:transcription elongation factor, mitochondrial isoform X2 [Atheta coriaria]|uniref:transcription elongation factor, mitochondrial isoform X2 n=1 Tax=Dalotia coriaria TaxID=877792 RepID=UPI0031F3F84E
MRMTANKGSSCFWFRCINSSSDIDLHFKPRFTDEEEAKILSIINQENTDQLLKFDMTRGRVKNLEMWRIKNGPFHSLSEILEVEGLGEKVLERLCNSIILNKTNDNNLKTAQGNRKQLVTPPFDTTTLTRLQSAVGIHACATGVSWAKLNKDTNEVDDWNFQDFSFLPKKMLSTETYDIAVEILKRLPDADVYVMEATPTISPQNPQATKALPAYNQHMELTSMLLALINSSGKHGCIGKLEGGGLKNGEYDISRNKVYFLRAYLSARLFKTLVGNERVSSGAIISKLLDGHDDLPCTAITTKGLIKSEFMSQSSVHKDLLGHALMLIVSFMNLCVYKNAASLHVINSRGRKN